jgi:hypothetical protein
VHGDVSAHNVLVEGHQACLSDFGLSGAGATAEDDRAGLARLRRLERVREVKRRRSAVLVTGAVAAAGAVAAVALVARDGPDTGVGSRLAAGALDSVDCEGQAPSGASLACTISQRDLGGRPVVVPVDGTVVSWAVRGARGRLALQVLRASRSGLVEVGQSAETEAPGPDVHTVPSRLPVAAGDRVALEVAPGAAVGLRRDGPPASTDRWFGPLLAPARAPERPAGTGLDRELLLRVDVLPGAGPGALAPLRGSAAAVAPAGRRVAVREVELDGGGVRRVAVVVLHAAVAFDLFDGARRVARTPMRDADARGGLIRITAEPASVRVRWRNPDGSTIVRAVDVAPGGFSG